MIEEVLAVAYPLSIIAIWEVGKLVGNRVRWWWLARNGRAIRYTTKDGKVMVIADEDTIRRIRNGTFAGIERPIKAEENLS